LPPYYDDKANTAHPPDHFGVFGFGIDDIPPLAQMDHQGHDSPFTKRVNGRVGHLIIIITITMIIKISVGI